MKREKVNKIEFRRMKPGQERKKLTMMGERDTSLDNMEAPGEISLEQMKSMAGEMGVDEPFSIDELKMIRRKIVQKMLESGVEPRMGAKKAAQYGMPEDE